MIEEPSFTWYLQIECMYISVYLGLGSQRSRLRQEFESKAAYLESDLRGYRQESAEMKKRRKETNKGR